MVREYIGARYVPKFMGTWSATTDYEALSIVDDGLGTSYTSKKPVPAGTVLTDTEYWALTGSTSGAIVNLQNRVSFLENEYANVKFYGAVGNGLTDDTNAFKAAIATGLNVYVPEGRYIISDYLEPLSNTIIFGNGTLIDTKVNANDPSEVRTGLIEINTKSNIVIDGIKIEGQGASSSTYTYGSEIHTFNANNILIRDVEIYEVKKTFAICFETSNKVKAENCYIHKYTYSGIAGANTTNDLEVINCTIIDAMSLTANNTYPITLNCYTEAISSLQVVGKNLKAIGNTIDNPTNGAYWEGIDAHGGENIVVADNVITNCFVGVAISSQAYFPAKNVIVANNVLDHGSTGSQRTVTNCGISFSFVTNGIVEGNLVKSFGKLSTTTPAASGIYVPNSKNVKICNNELFDCGAGAGHYGIFVHDSDMVDIHDNYIHDNNLTSAIRWITDTNRLYVHDNIIRTSGNMTDGNTTHAAPQDIRVFNNDSDNYFNAGYNKYVPQYAATTTISQVVNGKVGDIIYNNQPVSGAPLGWICTAAQTDNTPATYAALANIA